MLSSVTQIAATALLLRVMHERNFALGTAYAKTEVLQVAIFGLIFLGDPVTPGALIAIAFAMPGVMLLAPIDRQRPLRTLLSGWTTRPALLGLASGSLFGIAAVGYRGAALALEDTAFLMAAASRSSRHRRFRARCSADGFSSGTAEVIARVLREWRGSIFAGLMGATASACWFTAMAIEPAAHVRTLALVEVFFGYVVAHRFFRERVNRIEMTGMVLLVIGLVVVTLAR